MSCADVFFKNVFVYGYFVVINGHFIISASSLAPPVVLIHLATDTLGQSTYDRV